MRNVPYSTMNLASPPQSPPSPAKCDSQRCPWWPYTSSKDFKSNTILIIAILFCSLFCALAFNSAIRYIIRLNCNRRNVHGQQPEVVENQKREVETPALIYSEGVKLAGTEADCTICLLEFAIGEPIRVLENCHHGFHVQCVEQWLVSHSSCPTCRTEC